MLEHWIDEIPKMLSEIVGHEHRMVRAYRLVGVREVPDELSEYPCALTIPQAQANIYNQSHSEDFTSGIIELHLFEDMKNSRLPDVVPYFGKVRDVFASHLTLGGWWNTACWTR